MQLVIDIGNTRIKAAIFEKNELIHHFIFDSIHDFLQKDLFSSFPVQNSIVCSVINDMDELLNELSKKTTFLLFAASTPVPVKNAYASVQTLGSDRLAAAVGGNAICSDRDLLVIDAGTCIKYNFVSRNNEYLGGAISPGLKMRLKALHTFTARLPLLDVDHDTIKLIGTTTNESILSGALLGAVAEVDGIIAEYMLKYPNLKVFITGGDVNFFEKRLKNTIFADPHLILKGLNAILNYNIKPE